MKITGEPIFRGACEVPGWAEVDQVVAERGIRQVLRPAANTRGETAAHSRFEFDETGVRQCPDIGLPAIGRFDLIKFARDCGDCVARVLLLDVDLVRSAG